MPALQPAHSPHVGRFTLTDDSSSAMEIYHHKPKTQIGFCGGQESEVDTSGTVSDYTNGKAIKDQEQTGHDLQTNLHVSFEGNFLPSLTDDSSSAMEVQQHWPRKCSTTKTSCLWLSGGPVFESLSIQVHGTNYCARAKQGGGGLRKGKVSKVM